MYNMNLKKGSLHLTFWLGIPYRVISENNTIEYVENEKLVRFTFDIRKQKNFTINEDGKDIITFSEKWKWIEYDNNQVDKNLIKFINYHDNSDIQKIEGVFLFPTITITKQMKDKDESKEELGFRFEFIH